MFDANEMKQIGGRISACRQNKNMTQEELAYRLGITPQALSKWERGVGLPDVSMVIDLCGLLGVSADYLLGMEARGAGFQKDGRVAGFLEEIRKNLMDSLELQLLFGTGMVPLFVDNKFVDKIFALRGTLAREGLILPIVRIRDYERLGEQEFMITVQNNVLHAETLERLDENTVDEMIRKLGECVRKHYDEVLTPDLIKIYTDNLRMKYPALMDGVVPEKISYNLLAETARLVLRRGDSLVYLPRMIEIMDCALRKNPDAAAEELAERIGQVLEREDNIDVILGKRTERQP
ncbi:helix-turn-helix domain-containing protein [bacterium D16-50]|nr:helix-turn-helix domain-containing protein [bacterium D16-50]